MMHIIFDDVYRSCVIGRYKRDFTQKENHQGGYLRGCHKIYKVYALYGLFYQYKECDNFPDYDSVELLRLYNERLSKKGTQPRKYYNELIKRSPDRKCLLCHVGEASTLDHFLPKDIFPSLSISYNNLIPACDYCNRTKSKYYSLTKEQQLIHPLFDLFYNHNWLKATYSERDNVIYFDINYAPYTIEYARALFHVKKFGLLETYSAKSISLVKEIVGIAIDHDLSLSDVIEIKRRMLIRRSTSAAKSKYTIDLWKWLTLEALEASIVFMNNGKDIFGSISIFEMSSATYE